MSKLKYTEGCTCYGLDIDEVSSNNISTDNKKKLCLDLMNRYFTDSDWENELINICQSFGNMEFLFHCEQCNDDVYEYTLEI